MCREGAQRPCVLYTCIAKVYSQAQQSQVAVRKIDGVKPNGLPQSSQRVVAAVDRRAGVVLAATAT
jgi:hypothetical protein